MATCSECETEVRTPARGPVPSRCPACKALRKKAARQAKDIRDRGGRPKKKPGPKRNYDNPYDQKTVEGRRRYRHMVKYGLAAGEFEQRLEAQGGRCAICQSETPGGTWGWNVDHSHATGDVRGILCFHCNTGIGHLKDDPELCSAAADYLR